MNAPLLSFIQEQQQQHGQQDPLHRNPSFSLNNSGTNSRNFTPTNVAPSQQQHQQQQYRTHPMMTATGGGRGEADDFMMSSVSNDAQFFASLENEAAKQIANFGKNQQEQQAGGLLGEREKTKLDELCETFRTVLDSPSFASQNSTNYSDKKIFNALCALDQILIEASKSSFISQFKEDQRIRHLAEGQVVDDEPDDLEDDEEEEEQEEQREEAEGEGDNDEKRRSNNKREKKKSKNDEVFDPTEQEVAIHVHRTVTSQLTPLDESQIVSKTRNERFENELRQLVSRF